MTTISRTLKIARLFKCRGFGALCMATLPFHAFARGISDCRMVSAKIKNSVIDKVNTGIPFELLAIVSENEKPKCHRSLQIQLSLWDKKIRISDGEKLLARAGNDDFSELICRNLVCQNNVSPHGLGKVRVYLNPNWTGRLERLKARTSGLNTLLYSIDWEDFSKEKNKDSFIFEEDLIP